MQDRRSSGTKRLALNGILLAMTVITLFFATIMPTSRLSLYALSSFYIAILVIEYGIKNAWVFYGASCLLALVIIPDKPGLVPYIVFFGAYGIVKYYTERRNNRVLEYVIKLAYFNLCLAAALYLARQFFLEGVKISVPLWGVIIGLEVVFVVYDYVYTLFILYYRDRLKKMLHL
jgi:hypothetical protein